MKSVEVTIDMKRMGRFLQKRAAGTIAAQMNPLILTTKRPSENRQALLKKFAIASERQKIEPPGRPIYQYRQHGSNLPGTGEAGLGDILIHRIAFVDFPQSLQDGGAKLDLRTLEYPTLPQQHGFP